MDRSLLVVNRILSYIPIDDERYCDHIYRLGMRDYYSNNLDDSLFDDVVREFACRFVDGYEELGLNKEIGNQEVVEGFISLFENDPLFINTGIKEIFDACISKLNSGNRTYGEEEHKIIELYFLLSHYVKVYS